MPRKKKEHREQLPKAYTVVCALCAGGQFFRRGALVQPEDLGALFPRLLELEKIRPQG